MESFWRVSLDRGLRRAGVLGERDGLEAQPRETNGPKPRDSYFHILLDLEEFDFDFMNYNRTKVGIYANGRVNNRLQTSSHFHHDVMRQPVTLRTQQLIRDLDAIHYNATHALADA